MGYPLAMCEAKDWPTSFGHAVRAGWQLTAAKEELCRKPGKRQAAPFSKGGRSRPQALQLSKVAVSREVTERGWLAPDVEADSSMRECGLSTQPTFQDPR